MTDRTMRLALFLAALTVLVWFGPTAVEAQAISANATIYVTPVGGSEIKLTNGSNVYISNAECEGTWRFELQGYSTAVAYLEMWATNNTSTDCTSATNRSNPNNTIPVCWRPIPTAQNAVRGKTTFDNIPGGAIFDFDRDGNCDPGIMGTKYKVQFVTLDSPTQGAATTVTASNNNPNQISALFTLYSEIPAAPTSPKGVSGGRTLGISFDQISNDPLTQYRAVFDHDPNAPVVPNGLDGGTDIDAGAISCGTGKLDTPTGVDDAGNPIAPTGDIAIDNMTTFESGETKGKSVSISDLDTKGIGFYTYTAVSVYAIDGAGNRGTLSAPICVERVETLGYLDLCHDAGTNCGDLETCSLSSKNTGSAFWLSACTLALSAWARRRRRST